MLKFHLLMDKKVIKSFIPFLIFYLGALATLSIVLFINQKIDDSIVTKNNAYINELRSKVEVAFDQYLHPLEGTATLYQLENFSIGKNKFRKIAETRNLFKGFKGALGFGFIRYVKEKDITQFERKIKLDNPDFQLKRLVKDNQNLLTKDYFVIEVIEPFEVNSKAIGLVVSDEKNRYEAAIKSMKDGVPVLSKPIQLVQDNTKVPGFLLYYPIYSTLTPPKTEQERIEKFVGWTYAPILSSAVFDFIKQISPNLPPVVISEESNPNKQLVNTFTKNEPFTNSIKINFLGSTWLIRYNEDLAYDNNFHHVTLGISFLLFVGFFGFISYYLHRKNIELARFVQEEIISKEQIRIATDTINSQRVFFKKMLDSIPSLIGYWDKNLNNIFSNNEYYNYYGKRPEEIFGMHISELISNDIYEINKPLLEKALNGEMQTFRRKITKINNIKVEVITKYIPDIQNGEVIGIFAFVEDISEISQKDEQINLLLEVIEFAPVAIEITNKNNLIEYVNTYHVNNTGYSKAETVNNNPSKFSSGKTPKSTYIDLYNKINNYQTWTGEFINKKKNGDEYIEEATISALRNSDDEITHFVAIKKDITEFKRAESQLIFNSKLASIGEMAAGVAHEINNPLAIIQMSIDSIDKKSERNNLTTEILKEIINKIRVNSNRIARIVKSLKLYTRDTTEDDYSKIKISSIIDSVLDLCLEKVRFNDIQFEVAKYDDFEIECNEIKVQQVLVNLINNSSDAIDTASFKWIRLVIESDLHNVYFKIFDSGNIKDDVQEKMFNPFFTTKPQGKGTGLGLSIALNIAKEHKGTLFLDKTYSNTCFVLKFPIKRANTSEENSKIAS